MHQYILGQRYPFILALSVVVVLFFSSMPLLAAAPDDPRVTELKREAAKEGKVVLYTSIAVADAPVFVGNFQKKYPFIKVDLVRLNNMGILNRVLAEQRANKNKADVVALKGDVIYRMQGMELLSRYLSPERKFFAERFKDREGFWTDVFLTVHSMAYNTHMVAPHEVPTTYQDLLKPRWKGRIGFNPNNYMWLEAVMQTMGKEEGLKYLEALARQNPIVRDGGALNLILTAAGELAMSLPINHSSVENLKAQGAPVDWAKIKPFYGDQYPIALTANTPHPNAGKLFIDYMLSQEGQELIFEVCKTPPRTGLKSKAVRSEEVTPNDLALEKTQYYQTLIRQIFAKK